MGYKSKRQVYVLAFPDGHPAHGLEVRAGGASIDGLLKVNRLYQAALAGRGMASVNAESVAAVEQLMDIFGRAIISWNVEDDHDQPIPCTRENLGAISQDELLAVVMAWARTIGEASAPLETRSTPNGPTSTLSMIPMAPMPDVPVNS